MLQRDYLMQLLSAFIQAILNSRKTAIIHPKAAADSIEDAIAGATDIDGATLLSLSPESIATVMDISGVDPMVAGYISHSLMLESEYLQQAGEYDLAELRAAQAQSIAATFEYDDAEISAALEEAD